MRFKGVPWEALPLQYKTKGGRKLHKKIICGALSAAMFLTLFSACGRSEESVVNTKNSSFIEQEEVVDSPAKIFFSAWNGSEITADTAREHGMIFMDSSEESDMRWAEFCECVKSGTEAEITVCTSTQVIHAESSLEGDSGVLTIESEDFSEGSMKLFSKKLSADSFYSVCENGLTVYYAGSNKLYQTENVTSELTDVPFEQKIYKCSSEANMTFPYQKMFSNYDDFSEYYLKYNGELQIQEMKKDMEAFENEGGFNNHVIFLKGELSGYEHIDYKAVRAVKDKDSLFIYVAKEIPENKAGATSKRQITVTVPSEYLDEISPKNIKWIVFTQD